MTAEVVTLSHVEHGLTKHPQGSLRELWAISFPLMLSLMSSSLMFFWDRMLLAKFSIDAHNAATSAGSIVSFLQFGFICTACIAEVFVGQYNGAGKREKIGEPVWQMIWLSVLSAIVFIPLGLFAGDFLFQDTRYTDLENTYFKYLMYFGPIFCLNGALSAFYVGRGCVKIVTVVVILSNIINTLVSYGLIFGIEPYIPEMGIGGAALATGLAQTFQCLIMFYIFLKPENQRDYGTGKFSFRWNSFWECFSVGFPNSIAHTIEIAAWVVFFRMLTNAGDEHITVVSIAQSIFFLFTFVTEGVSKGAAAISANFIGAKRWDLVWRLLRSGIKFYVVVFLILGWFLVINPTPLIDLFFIDDHSEAAEATRNLIQSACFWVWIFFLFDGITWLVVGLLTSAGDTKFVMKTGGTTAWMFGLLPTYVLVVVMGHSADVAWTVTALYGLANCSIYLWRFYGGRWKDITITA